METFLAPGKPPAAAETAFDRLEHLEALDGPAERLAGLIKRLPLGARDQLHGRALGHPLHPVLVQVSLGCWVAAGVLDMIPGQRRAAGLLLATGTAAALPTAFSGWVDWSDLRPEQQRVGLVHAVGNSVALLLFGASLRARLRGHAYRGRGLSLAGLSVAGLAGWLGGHLAYRQAAGVNHVEQLPYLLPEDWTELGRLDDFEPELPTRRDIGTVPVVVVRRRDGRVRVLAGWCSHLAGPLDQGTLVNDCLVCPWHGSTFRLDDGSVAAGPATSPQPAFEVRVRQDGVLEARLDRG
ncbi:Rieske 2Fe-2S domain-containing protein [Streptacidiphilus monticola]|uniref:Rieske 2Fe-2S domain-containing protein n=1 Tax=Streptacidiphilus monticola TaxID=2161674 RepID=A0ABW1G9Z7_9ACTN